MPPKDLLNHPTTPCSLEACKLAEPRTVQDGTPTAASAPASTLLARHYAPSRLAQKLAPFRPLVERSVEQSVPPAGSGPHDFATVKLSMALMHASAAPGVVGEKRQQARKDLLKQIRCRGSTCLPPPLREGGITSGFKRAPPLLLVFHCMGLVNRTWVKLEIQRLVNPGDRRGMPILALTATESFLVSAQYDEHQ